LLAAIVPQIPALVSGSSTDEGQILEYLRNTTLVGLLPVPHPILLRRYQSNAVAKMWFTTFMYASSHLRCGRGRRYSSRTHTHARNTQRTTHAVCSSAVVVVGVL
jgi:hypothetical protein